MLDDATLAMNVLSFRAKSFGYERTVDVGGVSYGLFQRTETENESKLRPKLWKLWLVTPLDWLVYDEVADSIRIDRTGSQLPVLGGAEAQEIAAEPERFEESGVPWRRETIGRETVLYVPEARHAELLEAGPGREALRAAGLAVGTT